ncbi:SMI1/KNR4 family protein [Lysinibacillus fusiformis]|uniref:SMI1/KNR4 family protein n=1 Tax=Lysinibacillus fusiformis TaxID=28031 RepID=UPI0018E5B0EA|nr:SMI1/KNR4 family protein [Lysinibacillus fusiformis]MBI6864423.1 SMI1/KNR4 family protein [Lysinibacillus fusiformis]
MNFYKSSDIEDFLTSLEKDSYPMKPCSKDDILKLVELSPTRTLPKTYLDFMNKAGNGIEFLVGTDYSMKYIFDLKEWAIELLEENNSIKILTDNQFIFMMNQGYMFWFFNLNDGYNPAVYCYDESVELDDFNKVSDTLSDFLISLYH